jgi:Protein of unknown function (DUF1162).
VIEVFQPEVPKRRAVIQPNRRKAFHFAALTKEYILNFASYSHRKHIRVQISPTEHIKLEKSWEESGNLDVASPGDTQFLCQTLDKSEFKFFNLSVTLEDPYLFLTLEEQEHNDSLLQLQNNTNIFDIEAHQENVPDCVFKVQNGKTTPFAWPQPILPPKLKVKLIMAGVTSTEMVCNIEKINQVQTANVVFKSGTITVSYYTVLHGSSRIVKFSVLDNTQKEESKEEESTEVLVRAHIASMGISLITTSTSIKCELAHICLAPIMFVYMKENSITTMHYRIKAMVVDNNIREGGVFPVMIFPENAKRLKEKDLPFLDIVCKIQNKRKDSDVNTFSKLF